MLRFRSFNDQLSEDAFWSLQAALAKMKGKRKCFPGNLQSTTSIPISTMWQNAQPQSVKLDGSFKNRCKKRLGHSGQVSRTLYEPRTGEPTRSWFFFLEQCAKFFYYYYSLRNQWVGTDGKWEAAKGKKMVSEWSAETERLSTRASSGPRWRCSEPRSLGTAASAAPPVCCQRRATRPETRLPFFVCLP